MNSKTQQTVTFKLDDHFCWTAVDPVWEKEGGYPIATLKGRAIHQIVHPMDHRWWREKEQEAKAKMGVDCRLGLPGGYWHWGRFELEPTATGWNGNLVIWESESDQVSNLKLTRMNTACQRLSTLFKRGSALGKVQHVLAGLKEHFAVDRIALFQGSTLLFANEEPVREANEALELDLLWALGEREEGIIQLATDVPVDKGNPQIRTFFAVGIRFGLRHTGYVLSLVGSNALRPVLEDMETQFLEWAAGRLLIPLSHHAGVERFENQLKDSQARVNTHINTVPDAVISMDIKGRVIEWNPVASKMFGFAEAEVIGKRMSELIIPPVYREAHEKGLKRFIQTGHGPVLGNRIEIEGHRKNGEIFPIELTVTHIQLTDSQIFTAYIRDITYRKESERKREYLLETLEKTNRELGEFAYIVSHDLKAPLRAIGSLSSWLQTDYYDKIDEEGQEILSLLQNRVKRMHNLIEGILMYSRVGRTEEIIEEVDLNIVISDVMDMLMIPDHITLLVENELPIVKWDRTRAFQVFQNLIGNALKYHDKPEGIIRVWTETKKSGQLIHVEDDGPGIDPAYHQRIFQIFQTLKARDEMESTGIGLTLVKKILELYGAVISVDSEVGKGTRFTIKLTHT